MSEEPRQRRTEEEIAPGQGRVREEAPPYRRDAEDVGQAVPLDSGRDQVRLGAVVNYDRAADQEVGEDDAVRPAGVEKRVDDDADVALVLPGLQRPCHGVEIVGAVGKSGALREAGGTARVEDDMGVVLADRDSRLVCVAAWHLVEDEGPPRGDCSSELDEWAVHQ